MSLNWVEKHSTNCKHCGHLVDERECVPEDDGDICQDCYNILENERKEQSNDD
jgi:formylmethanofuran dehydrogenase subunit E